jgi:oxaloacetate decarboxylase alpha subunit
MLKLFMEALSKSFYLKTTRRYTYMALKIVETSLRDGHQSLMATRMTTKDILSIVPELDKAGFHALEVWGGATFDACLRFLDEDPWERLREIKKLAPNTKLQMLFRGQNILGYRHYPDDIVEKFVQKSIENGIDIIRIFDALNDIRNLKSAVDATKKYGGHCQIALSYTTSPVHTIEYYVKLAKEVEAMGADSLCIKDMAGILLPDDAYNLITQLKRNTKLPINLHGHATAGIMQATYLKAIEAGVDIIDTALSPLSGGTSQVATESFCYILKDTKYDPKLNLDFLNQAAAKLTIIKDQAIKDGILNPKALTVNPSILEYQVPGGMLSNLMSQLREQNQMDDYEKVLKEVPIVRKDLGYPPLVTPMSQMIGTQALMNVMTQNPYKIVSKEIKEYLHGLYGKAPAKIDSILLTKIIGDDKIITHRPADDLKPEFENLKKKYGDFAKSDEDLLSIALFGKVAISFLEKKYKKTHEPRKEVYAFSVTIGGDQ